MIAKNNPGLARAQAKEQAVRAAIAQVTAQEQKVWERENTKKVEATQAYKENENKGQHLKQELRNIRTDEAEYRAEQAEREQAMQSHRQGEKDAVAIAADYETRMQEQAMLAHRIGEQNAVEIAEEHKVRIHERAQQSHREGERDAMNTVREYAAQTYREGERTAFPDPNLVCEPGPSFWDRARETFINISLAVGGVETARDEVIKEPQMKVDLRKSPYASESQLESILKKLGVKMDRIDVGTAESIQDVIADQAWDTPLWKTFITGIQEGKIKQSLQAGVEEISLHLQAVKNKLTAIGEAANYLFSGRVKDYSLPMPRLGNLFDGIGNVGDLISLPSSIAYMVTGDKRWDTASDAGQVLGVPAAAMQIYNNWTPALQAFTKAPVSKGVSFLGKVAGPLAVVTGGFSVYSGAVDWDRYRKEGNTQMAWASGLEAFAGVAAIAGGVALLIPGAQPVAAVALGISAVVSVISLTVENWDSIQNFFTRPEGPYPGIRATPVQPENNLIPTSTPQTTHPPATPENNNGGK